MLKHTQMVGKTHITQGGGWPIENASIHSMSTEPKLDTGLDSGDMRAPDLLVASLGSFL